MGDEPTVTTDSGEEIPVSELQGVIVDSAGDIRVETEQLSKGGGSSADARQASEGQHVFTDVETRTGHTQYHHNDCGKVWTEPSDDPLPNYCPGCGVSIYDD